MRLSQSWPSFSAPTPLLTDSSIAVQDGWNDDGTSENADKCAWYHTQNITLGGHQFAVQPTWSNEAFDAGKDGCAVSR